MRLLGKQFVLRLVRCCTRESIPLETEYSRLESFRGNHHEHFEFIFYIEHSPAICRVAYDLVPVPILPCFDVPYDGAQYSK